MRIRSGFSLLEIVVVMGIIMILYAIIFPVLRSARLRSQETHCASNLHQVWLALNMYHQDYEEFPNQNPIEQLQPGYVTDPSIFLCPQEWRDVSLLDHGIVKGKLEPSSYIWSCIPMGQRDEVYKRRGEQMPEVLCGVHTLPGLASGPPFWLIVRYDGSIHNVLMSTATKLGGNSYEF